MSTPAVVPAESHLLCEGCGYTLVGLPGDSRCPECGRLIDQSTGQLRVLPAWEGPGRARLSSFLRTTAHVLFRPERFYRTLITRAPGRRAGVFARVHFALCSVLIGASAAVHLQVLSQEGSLQLAALVGVCAWVFLQLSTYWAARLTAWEAAYRGLRLPLPVVVRAMNYHTPHYLPVCLVVAATIGGYERLMASGAVGVATLTTYLYVLCAEVVLGAVYLFWTYWIGMRNIMFANR
jgi:hypothetical protein